VRVKRRLEDDPVDSLVLLCKKVKRDTDIVSDSACQPHSTEAVKSVFKFAGTVSGPVSMHEHCFLCFSELVTDNFWALPEKFTT